MLFAYFIFMAIYFGRDMIAAGRMATFTGIVAGETVILILLVIFLRKRGR